MRTKFAPEDEDDFAPRTILRTKDAPAPAVDYDFDYALAPADSDSAPAPELASAIEPPHEAEAHSALKIPTRR